MKIAMSSFVSEVKVYAGEDSWEVIGGRLIGKVKNLKYRYTITQEEIKKNLDKSYKQLRETFKNHSHLRFLMLSYVVISVEVRELGIVLALRLGT